MASPPRPTQLPTPLPPPGSRRAPGVDVGGRWRLSGRVRIMAAVLGLTAIGVNALLMMSDRAPRVVGGLVTSVAVRLDPHGRIERVLEQVLPEGEVLVHLLAWWVVAFLVGMTVASRRGLVLAVLLLAWASVVVEFAQGVYTSTRSVESVDLVANLVGVVGGGISAAVVASVAALLRIHAARRHHR